MHEVEKHRAYEFENFRLDADHMLLFCSGERVNLTPKVVETLLALVEANGEVVSKDELMQSLWPDTSVEESNLSQNLYLLRKALGSRADGKPFIETLRRRGYRFQGDISYPQPRSKRSERRRPLNVERTENIYSVADWRRDELPKSQPPFTSRRPFWLISIVSVLIAAVLAAFGFGLYRISIAAGETGIERVGVPFEGKSVERLTTSGRTTRAAISPDARYIAHVSTDADGSSLWVRQVSASSDIRIAGPSPSEFAWVTVAGDSNSVFLLTLDRDKGDTELFRVPLLGGPAIKVANDTGPVGFSADGSSMAFIRNYNEETRLIVAGADGSNEKVLASLTQPEYFSITWNAPAWSPDGKTLACPARLSDDGGHFETIIGVDVGGGNVRRLTESRWQLVGQPQWTKDGLLTAAKDRSTGPQQLWHIDSGSGRAKRITHDLNDYYDVSVSADGSIMTAVQDHVVSSFFVSDDKTFREAREISSEIGVLDDFAWAADDRIVFKSNAGNNSEIWTMNKDGSGARQITAGSQAGPGISVSPDSSRIVFSSERSGRSNLWVVNSDGSDLRQLTNGSEEVNPQFTPDGKWIIYQQGENNPGLWKIPASGGEPIHMTTSRALSPVVSPDGKLIAYRYLDSSFERSRWSIGVTSIDGGPQIKRFDFPATVAERFIRFSPDSQSIAFINNLKGTSEIWLQPLNGSAAKPLSFFGSQNITAFDWSRDGNSVATIRSAQTRDVIMLKR